MNDSDPHNHDPEFHEPDTQKMIQRVTQSLDSETLDKETQTKLQHARYAALENSKKPWFSGFTAPAIAFASIAAIAVVITLSITPQSQTSDINNIETFEIITSNDSLELFENLEFYLWMEQENKV